jgi:glutamate racemase
MIGVFDSGHGGLTVLRALTARLPDQRFVYLGDHAYAPYGMRSEEEIYQLTRRRVAALIERGCRLVVLACNTASAVALRRLQREWLPRHAPDARVLGVFIPVVEALTAQSWGERGPSPLAPPRPVRTVGILATRRTVESRAFPDEIRRRATGLTVVQQPCPRLAEAIEAGLEMEKLRAGVATYCEQLLAKAGRSRLDLVVLGCTHFPLVEEEFCAALPRGIRILDQPQLAAEALAGYLGRHPEFADPRGTAGAVEFLTSGDPDLIGPAAARFYGAPAAFRHLSGAAVSPQASGETRHAEEEETS